MAADPQRPTRARYWVVVFAVTLVCNVGGAMGIYWLAARHSSTLFARGTVMTALRKGSLLSSASSHSSTWGKLDESLRTCTTVPSTSHTSCSMFF